MDKKRALIENLQESMESKQVQISNLQTASSGKDAYLIQQQQDAASREVALTNQILQLRENQENERDKSQIQIAELESELNNMKQQALLTQTDMHAGHMNEINKVKDFWEHKFQKEIEEVLINMRHEHREEVDKLKLAMQENATLETIRAEQISQEHAQKMSELWSEIETCKSAFEEEIQVERDNHKSNNEELLKQHALALAAMKQNYAQEMQHIQDQNRCEIEPFSTKGVQVWSI